MDRSQREVASRMVKARAAARVGATDRERLSNAVHEVAMFSPDDLNVANGCADLAPILARILRNVPEVGIAAAVAMLSDEEVRDRLRELQAIAEEVERRWTATNRPR